MRLKIFFFFDKVGVFIPFFYYMRSYFDITSNLWYHYNAGLLLYIFFHFSENDRLQVQLLFRRRIFPLLFGTPAPCVWYNYICTYLALNFISELLIIPNSITHSKQERRQDLLILICYTFILTIQGKNCRLL